MAETGGKVHQLQMDFSGGASLRITVDKLDLIVADLNAGHPLAFIRITFRRCADLLCVGARPPTVRAPADKEGDCINGTKAGFQQRRFRRPV